MWPGGGKIRLVVNEGRLGGCGFVHIPLITNNSKRINREGIVGVHASKTCGCTPNAQAATSSACTSSVAGKSPRITATRVSPGLTCVSSSSRFVDNSGLRIENPVAFPPGCAMREAVFAKEPAPAMIMGIVVVACCASRAVI